MILVLLGTQNNDFSRLLSQIELCIDQGVILEDVVVQAGHTKYISQKMKIFDFIPKNELDQLIASSQLIITHGGVGSIMKGIKHRKKVIAIPRLAKYNEHVNDHQIQIVENFNRLGYIKGVLNIEDLPTILDNINEFIPSVYENKNSKIEKLISDFIDNN